MQVGVNYPWLDYGWDFGLGPPAWRGARTTPRWHGEIDRHLDTFRDLGISVVRWFILADGLTYGTGESAPKRVGTTPWAWRFTPPPLSAEFLRDFETLLERFGATGDRAPAPIQLLPVLIDFHFCGEGITTVERPDPAHPARTVPDHDWVKQGRADAIADPVKLGTFLNEVLDPLLRVSRRHAGAIYAWELINEPDWITRGWHPSPLGNPPIPAREMRAFLEEGTGRIRRAGFKPTIGFASAHTLRRSGISTEINQFHHYPGGSRQLERQGIDRTTPRIIGEFATDPTDVWPDLRNTGQTVLDRLRLADQCGYSLAIPWSFLAYDRHTAWSAAVERDVRTFTGGRG